SARRALRSRGTGAEPSAGLRRGGRDRLAAACGHGPLQTFAGDPRSTYSCASTASSQAGTTMPPDDDLQARVRQDPPRARPPLRQAPAGVRRALLAMEIPAVLDFDDPSLGWRRLFSETLGTFMLVLAGAGAVVVDAVSGGSVGRTAAVVAPGLTVMAVILFMG